MTEGQVIFRGGRIFDGTRLLENHALRLEDGVVVALDRDDRVETREADIHLAGDILSPGYVDLQVNGGDGVMFNDDPSVETLERIATAHRRLGTAAILPTLITDTPEISQAAVQAAAAACAAGVEGITGLHLEGPHLSQARKGAHDPSLIRPMTEADMDLVIGATRTIPTVKMTIAPESVSLDQARRLVQAGVLLSLGHTDASYETCCAYADAGVRCVTHLFNAMSQLGNRAPGVVGAVLDRGDLSAGLIADGIHVHPAAMRAAFAAKTGPGQIFLVSDAMAPAGTDQTEFVLNGRTITRSDGRLTLADGTLAGADLSLTRAVEVAVTQVGATLEQALGAATSIPAALAGLPYGRLELGKESKLVRIAKDLTSARAVA